MLSILRESPDQESLAGKLGQENRRGCFLIVLPQFSCQLSRCVMFRIPSFADYRYQGQSNGQAGPADDATFQRGTADQQSIDDARQAGKSGSIGARV